MRRILLGALVLASGSPAFARMEEEPRSFSLSTADKQLENIQLKALPRVRRELLLAEDEAHGKNRLLPEPQRFAVAADVSYTLKNSGTWQNLPDGRLWRLRIHSPGALSHNLGITRFDLPEGAKLWLYDPGHSHVEGPYTYRNRSHHGSLWTPVIEGEDLVVELFLPRGGSTRPFLEITKVNQGYRGVFDHLQKAIPGAGTAGACEVNVVCPLGMPVWDDQIDAVGAYTVSGVATCTGTMLNNALVDFTPYFLSAEHCGVNSVNDSSVVVYWNYQSSTCTPTTAGSITDNQTGSTFLASYTPSDFLLLQLSSIPPSSYNVYYSGWDATGVAPPSTMAIHHPRLDVKKISESNTAPMSTFYGSSTPSVSGDHWRAVWSIGATEPGSSGSCLFSTATKRCIGQLHGGPSACGGASMWDYYGKFSVSFFGGGSSSNRLKDWLDPLNSGILAMDGDPHLTTLDAIDYDFQGAGEYVALRDSDGVEIQARMLPVSTAPTVTDPYDNLSTCVSVTTAVAAKVGPHRVTIQPNLSGFPDPSGLQVRINGSLISLGSSPVAVGSGGRVGKSGSTYEVNFPNGTALYVTPQYWSSQSKWYLNMDVFRPAASGGARPGSPGGGFKDVAGLLAPRAPGSWLPALPGGASLGAMPATLGQRYIDLYQNFGAAWRVGSASLFDYAPGNSTATFTIPSWPPDRAPCTVPDTPVARPMSAEQAAAACQKVEDQRLNGHCRFDVMATGEPGFADLFLATQRLHRGATFINVADPVNPSQPEEGVVFTATVSLRAGNREKPAVPAGTVEFFIDGKPASEPIALNGAGQASWEASGLHQGENKVSVRYTAAKESEFLDSVSFEEIHVVGEK